jgi:predicted HicB family RNase H-like nuclease
MKAIYVSDQDHERLKNEAFKRKISITALVAEKLKGGKKC